MSANLYIDQPWGYIVQTKSRTTEVTPENIGYLRSIIESTFYMQYPEHRDNLLRIEKITMGFRFDENYPIGFTPFREVNLFSNIHVLKTKRFKR